MGSTRHRRRTNVSITARCAAERSSSLPVARRVGLAYPPDAGDAIRRAMSDAGGPPGQKPAFGLLDAEDALVEAEVEQEPVRLPDVAARADAEKLLDAVAIELGPHGGELLLGRQLRDPPFDVVVGAREAAG